MFRGVAFWGLSWMAFSLPFAFVGEAYAQTSLTGINRDSVLQLNLGSGRRLAPGPARDSNSQKDRDSNSQKDQDPAIASELMWAEWHIRANVCTGNLSTEELAELFPLVNQELVDAVCQGGS